MKNRMIQGATALFVFLIALQSPAFTAGAYSGTLVTLSAFTYNTNDEINPGARSNSRVNIYDVQAGYLTGTGVYVGALYTYRNEDQGTDHKGRAGGVSLGYVGSSGGFIKAHGLFSATRGAYEDGSGFQADLGFIGNVSDLLFAGVQVSYRRLTYEKDTQGSAQNYKSEETYPMLQLGLLF